MQSNSRYKLHREHKLAISTIMSTVAKHYKLSARDLSSPRRSRALSRPRHMAMSLARELTGQSTPDIGAAFWRDPTTVLYADRRIQELRRTDQRIREDYDELLRILSR